VFALAHLGVIKKRRPRFVFGLGIGPTALELDWQDGTLRLAWMFQRAPHVGKPLQPRSAVAEAIGVPPSALMPKLPLQAGSSGLSFLLVPLRTRRAVDAAAPDRGALRAFYTRLNVQELPLFIFTTESGADGATVYGRMFAPGLGVAEDPATGSACGPLGAYLVRHGLVPRNKADSIVIAQGVKMGRPSRILVAVDSDSQGNVREVRVGGESVLIGEGTLKI
jgi:trans-2,3-dihydro-3-hydroxyanthranilate isomerase